MKRANIYRTCTHTYMHMYIWNMSIYMQNTCYEENGIRHRILFPLFPYVCANTHLRECPFLAGRTYSSEYVGSSSLKDSFIEGERSVERILRCHHLFTLFFSCLTYNQLISICAGSVGQANWKHIAHKSLQNLSVNWVFSCSAVPPCKQRHPRNATVRKINT